jgi:PE-PPE domain
VGNSVGKHRVARAKKAAPMAGAVGVAAAAGAAVVGLTPTIAASPQLMASTGTVHYLRGTNIGTVPSDADYRHFVGVVDGLDPNAPTALSNVVYPAGFFPVSKGYFNDPTLDASVADGLDELENHTTVVSGDEIFGFSQGAIVATEYKRLHPDEGFTYVLVENPNRPNGGILERFDGLSIPILGVTFNGATPTGGDPTIDVSRQYDAVSDFPAYPLNFLADANAILGAYYLHGSTQNITAADLSHIDKTNPMYYQKYGNDTYYLVPTDELPLLMPFNGIVPKQILDAADPPLRYLVELGYDRSNYSTPTPAGLVPTNLNPVTVVTGFAAAVGQGVEAGLGESSTSTFTAAKVSGTPTPSIASEPNVVKDLPKLDLPKPDLPKLDLPKIKAPKLIPAKPLKPLTVNLPSGNTSTTPKPATKAGNGGPVKSIQSAIKSISKSLAAKTKPKNADNGS